MIRHISVQLNFFHFTTESVWETILTLWETVFTRFPNTLALDDGLKLRDTFVEICEVHDVEWQRSGTQQHVVLGIGERHNEPVRRAFGKF